MNSGKLDLAALELPTSDDPNVIRRATDDRYFGKAERYG
jgi:hypothetical protein